MWNIAFWRPASQEPLADTAAAAASDAGAEVREPVPVGAGDAEDAEATPTVRQAAWSAAWQRHEAVATAGTCRPGTRATSVRALRPLPGVMVGATAAMVAVTVALTCVAGPLYGVHRPGRRRDLLDRTPVHRGRVSTDPYPAEEGRVTAGPAASRLRHQLPLLAWLVVVWILLWGTFSWANVRRRALVVGPARHAAAPAAAGGGLGRGCGRWPCCGSSGTSWSTSPSPARRWPGARWVRAACAAGRSSRVQLRADSDLLLTVVAETVSLVPGSLVLDLDREDAADRRPPAARRRPRRRRAAEGRRPGHGGPHRARVRDGRHRGIIGGRSLAPRGKDGTVIVVAVDRATPCSAAGRCWRCVRLARGPSLLDRVVATDTLLVIIAASLAVHAALSRDPTVVPVLVVVSLLAFVGSVSIARYVGGTAASAADDGQRRRPAPCRRGPYGRGTEPG